MFVLRGVDFVNSLPGDFPLNLSPYLDRFAAVIFPMVRIGLPARLDNVFGGADVRHRRTCPRRGALERSSIF